MVGISDLGLTDWEVAFKKENEVGRNLAIYKKNKNHITKEVSSLTIIYIFEDTGDGKHETEIYEDVDPDFAYKLEQEDLPSDKPNHSLRSTDLDSVIRFASDYIHEQGTFKKSLWKRIFKLD